MASTYGVRSRTPASLSRRTTARVSATLFSRSTADMGASTMAPALGSRSSKGSSISMVASLKPRAGLAKAPAWWCDCLSITNAPPRSGARSRLRTQSATISRMDFRRGPRHRAMRPLHPHLSRAECIPRPVSHSRCKGVGKVSVAERLVDGIGEMHLALVRVRLPRIFRLVLRNPRDSMCALALMTAVAAIVANSLYLQPGRHPAPIFAVRPLPVLSSEETGTATQLTRRRPPAADAQKPELAQRSDPVPLPRPRAQSTPGPRPDAAEATNPSRQLGAVQRILNEFG